MEGKEKNRTKDIFWIIIVCLLIGLVIYKWDDISDFLTKAHENNTSGDSTMDDLNDAIQDGYDD